MKNPIRHAGDVEVGAVLPSLSIPIDRTFIAASAIATRDYQPVHHDAEAARARGSEDVFMNILTSNGLVGRFVSAWAGPNAVLRKIAIRLGAPNYPGDTMVMSGEVTSKRVQSGVAEIEVTLRGKNGRGDHIVGTAVLTLPNHEAMA
jgi:acyl dehydratase